MVDLVYSIIVKQMILKQVLRTLAKLNSISQISVPLVITIFNGQER